MKRALVTGSGGFIGRHVVPHLIRRGYEVHGVHLHGSPASGTISHQADLLDPTQVSDLLNRILPTHLVHLAWYAEHGKFWNSPLNTDWAKASEKLFDDFIASGGRRAVFAGTCAEYDWTHSPLREDTTPSNPATLYGVCKNNLRQTVETAAKNAKVSVAWARIFFLYGRGEDGRRFIPSILKPLLNNQPAIVKNGSHTRDFMHCSDVGAAFAAILDSELTGIVNVASGEATSLGEIAKILAELTGTRSLLQVRDGPPSPDDPAVLTADVARLRSIGFKPAYSLRDGLATLIP